MCERYSSFRDQTKVSIGDERKCPCEFCRELFAPRPQTKNPWACDKKSCQQARQKANEQEWRKTNQPQRPPEYFAAQRKQRFRRILELIEKLCKCLTVGSTMLGQWFSAESFRLIFIGLFQRLGIRCVNKLCRAGNDLE